MAQDILIRAQATAAQARVAVTLIRLLMAALVFIACWLLTSDTRLDPNNGDPLTYVHAAASLHEGRGLIDDINSDPSAPLSLFPPLYPILLSVAGGSIEAARTLNAVLLWATLLLGWLFLTVYDFPTWLRIGTLIALLFYVTDWSRMYSSAMSESLFNLLFLAWLLVMPYTETDTGVVAYGLLSLMLSLTRYIGVPLLAISLLWILYRRGWFAALASLALPGIGLTWWLSRNFYLVGAFTGHAAKGAYSWLSIYQLATVIAEGAALVAVFGSGAFCLSVCCAWLWRRISASPLPADS